MQHHSFAAIPAAAFFSLIASCALAQSDVSFKGQLIKLHLSANAGGGYDAVARIFIKYYPKYIPGNPGMVVTNMVGAGGITMTNWVYNIAPKDGTVLGMPHLTVPMNQVIMPEHVRFDAARLNWIGNLEESTASLFTYHTSKTRTIEDARKRETIMGASTKGNILYQMLALSNRLLDTKFKIVLGYERTRIIAIESGELEGSTSNLENFAGIAPHWLKNNLINVLVINAPQRHPRFPDVPTMKELTTNEEHKKILEFMMLQSATSRAIFAPPGVPDAKVNALRRAFDKAAADPEFLAEIERGAFEITPSTGERTQASVIKLVATTPDVAQRALAAIE